MFGKALTNLGKKAGSAFKNGCSSLVLRTTNPSSPLTSSPPQHKMKFSPLFSLGLVGIGLIGIGFVVKGRGVLELRGSDHLTEAARVTSVHTYACRTSNVKKYNHYDGVLAAVAFSKDDGCYDDDDDSPQRAVIKRVDSPPILKDEEEFHMMREKVKTMKRHIKTKGMKVSRLNESMTANIAYLLQRGNLLTREIIEHLSVMSENLRSGVVDYPKLASSSDMVERLLCREMERRFGCRKAFENATEAELLGLILGLELASEAEKIDIGCHNEVAVNKVNKWTRVAKEKGDNKMESEERERVAMLVKEIVRKRLERERLGNYTINVEHRGDDDVRMAVVHALSQYGKAVCKDKPICYVELNADDLFGIDDPKVRKSLEPFRVKKEKREKENI